MAKNNKKVALTDLSVVELQEKLKDGVEELKKLRFNHTITPLTNPNEIGLLKKEVARMKTELTARKS